MERTDLDREDGLDAETLLAAEEAIAPGCNNPTRRRLIALTQAYQPLAKQHFEENRLWEKNK